MAEYYTGKFTNDQEGIRAKDARTRQLAAQGWRIASELIEQGHIKGGQACCGATLCLPLAFLAGRTPSVITVTFVRETNAPVAMRACAACGQVLSPEAQFCSKCGSANSIKTSSVQCASSSPQTLTRPQEGPLTFANPADSVRSYAGDAGWLAGKAAKAFVQAGSIAWSTALILILAIAGWIYLETESVSRGGNLDSGLRDIESSSAQHLRQAQTAERAGAAMADIDEALRHVRAIAPSAPETGDARALELKLLRAKRRLIQGSTKAATARVHQ